MCCNFDCKRFISDVLYISLAILYYSVWIALPQTCLMGRTCMTKTDWGVFCMFEWGGVIMIATCLISFASISTLKVVSGREPDFASCNTFTDFKKGKIYMILFIVGTCVAVGILHWIGYGVGILLFWRKSLNLGDYFTWKTGLVGAGVVVVGLILWGICLAIFLGFKLCIKRYTPKFSYSKIGDERSPPALRGDEVI